MLSEFLIRNTPIQDRTRFELAQRRYRATSLITYKGPTIVVEHSEAESNLVAEIVYAADPSAERC